MSQMLRRQLQRTLDKHADTPKPAENAPTPSVAKYRLVIDGVEVDYKKFNYVVYCGGRKNRIHVITMTDEVIHIPAANITTQLVDGVRWVYVERCDETAHLNQCLNCSAWRPALGTAQWWQTAGYCTKRIAPSLETEPLQGKYYVATLPTDSCGQFEPITTEW